MNIESQVCTRAQAEKFKQMGIAQESICSHGMVYDGDDLHEVVRIGKANENKRFQSAAFSAVELGRMIGAGTLAADKFWQHLLMRINSGNSSVICYNADDVAEFVLECFQTGVLTVEEVNTRLLKP